MDVNKELSNWLRSLPYWEKSLWSLSLEKETLTDQDIESIVEYYFQDIGVKPVSTTRPAITIPNIGVLDEGTACKKILIRKLEKIKNVNAISESSIIQFGDHLTLIYGPNGSGKSGIGRLLSNSCSSRKPREILPNLQPGTPKGQAEAVFTIEVDAESEEICYKLGDYNQKLKLFSVFDREGALIHLDQSNQIEFIPASLQVFDRVFKAVEKIEQKVSEHLTKWKRTNPFDGTASDKTQFANSITEILRDGDETKLLSKISFTEQEQKLLEKKYEEKTLIGTDMRDDKVARYKEQIGHISTLIYELKSEVRIVSERTRLSLEILVNDIKAKSALVSELSSKNFEFESFKAVGTPEWRALLVSARKLYELETKKGGGIVPNFCLLCRQEIGEHEHTLFQNYWDFLKGTAEEELSTAKNELEKVKKKLEGTQNNWRKIDSSSVAGSIVRSEASENINLLDEYLDSKLSVLNEWIRSIDLLGEFASVIIPKRSFSSLYSPIIKRLEDIKSISKPTKTPEELTIEIAELEAKKFAFINTKSIQEYIQYLKISKKCSSNGFAGAKMAITKKKSDILKEIVISKYSSYFNDEIKALDCDFGVQIVSHGKEGNSLTGLTLSYAKGYKLSSVLSEGEQRVTAYADFIAEAKVQGRYAGIIFDDPVTSLDHYWKKIIAKRLINEAVEKQVIIFTHDVEFLVQLMNYAEKNSVEVKTLAIQKEGKISGVVKDVLPWNATQVNKRIGMLKNSLVELKKIENGDPEVYKAAVKNWYEHLRESWERAVEERLFNGVVTRYDPAIHTNQLNKVIVNYELFKEVENGMSESSSWLHDSGVNVNPAIPTTLKLEGELEKLEVFLVHVKESQKL